MCCRLKISSCCCGLRALGPGVHSLGVAALLINLAMLLAPGWLGLPMVDQSGYEGWMMILMIADLGLALGARNGIKLLLLPWLILYMIHIVFSWILAPLIIFGAVTFVEHIRSTDIFEKEHNMTKESVSGMLPGHEDLQGKVEGAMDSVTGLDVNNLLNIKEEEVKTGVTLAVLVLLPVFYLYTWVAARSLYISLSMSEGRTSPGERRPPARMAAWTVQQGHPHPGQLGRAHSHPGAAGRAPSQIDHQVPWYVAGLQQERAIAMAAEQRAEAREHLQQYRQQQQQQQQQQHAEPWYQPPQPGARSGASTGQQYATYRY